MNRFEKFLEKKFELRKTKNAKHFIGFQIDQKEGSIVLHQNDYIQDSVTRFELEDAKSVQCPIDTVDFSNGNDLGDRVLFQQILGTILYIAVCSRPDVLYAASVLSQIQTNASSDDLKRAKDVLVYLRDTPY